MTDKSILGNLRHNTLYVIGKETIECIPLSADFVPPFERFPLKGIGDERILADLRKKRWIN